VTLHGALSHRWAADERTQIPEFIVPLETCGLEGSPTDIKERIRVKVEWMEMTDILDERACSAVGRPHTLAHHHKAFEIQLHDVGNDAVAFEALQVELQGTAVEQVHRQAVLARRVRARFCPERIPPICEIRAAFRRIEIDVAANVHRRVFSLER